MKVMWCGSCGAFLSPYTDPARWKACDCGQAEVRWENPKTGLLEVRAVNPQMVRVVGLHNGMLTTALKYGLRGITPEADRRWRDAHDVVCREAAGYLFHRDRRDCWAVITAPHESRDITWMERGQPPPKSDQRSVDPDGPIG